jgi:hypothetical protein
VDELNLEPYTVIQAWSLPEAGGNWESILGDYLQRIAQGCAASGKCVIGHIKAIATLPDRNYLRISVVAPNIPASIEGKLPPHCTNLELTLNVLVYGLERSVIEKITLEMAGEIARQRKGEVHQKNLPHASDHLFHSNHHNPSKGETQ